MFEVDVSIALLRLGESHRGPFLGPYSSLYTYSLNAGLSSTVRLLACAIFRVIINIKDCNDLQAETMEAHS